MSSEPTPSEKRLNLAVQARQLEIQLFWTRSTFFWAFIASAFIAYATISSKVEGDKFFLLLVVASFGFICSLAWTLANRGSKYWQENWEQKVNEEEKIALGRPFLGIPGT